MRFSDATTTCQCNCNRTVFSYSPFLTIVLLLATLSSVHSFHFKFGTKQLSPPTPSKGFLTVYQNETVRREFRIWPNKLISNKKKESEDSDTLEKKQSQPEPSSIENRVRQLLRAITHVFYQVKASCAIVAIQLVLSMRMERPVLSRLPPNLLIFLLEVSVNNPKVIRSVANELSNRISTEICQFTGKESYQVGDLSKAILSKYTGNDEYQFGDVTRSTLLRFRGKKNFRPNTRKHEETVQKLANTMSGFGSDWQVSTPAEIESLLHKVTGKKEYEFGDVTKALLKNMKAKNKA